MKTAAVLLAALACATSACHAGDLTVETARSRAAADFDCPSEQLSVEHAPGAGALYIVRGCGKEARYVCQDRGKREAKTGQMDYRTECVADAR